MSSSLLGKLASPFLCYKHIPSYNTTGFPVYTVVAKENTQVLASCSVHTYRFPSVHVYACRVQ